MNDIHAKKSSGMNPVVAGIAGAVAGGVAVAAAIALNTKENQKKVTTVVDAAKTKVADVVNETKKKIENKV